MSEEITARPGWPITIGQGRNNPRGMRSYVDSIADLKNTLENMTGRDIWWSLNLYTENHRTNDNWIGAKGVAIDLDWYDAKGEHKEERPTEAIRTSLRQAGIPNNASHDTPRGARMIYLLDHLMTSPDEMKKFAQDVSSVITNGLRAEGLLAVRSGANMQAGYGVDPASLVLAQMMFGPKALVGDEQRDSDVVISREHPFSAEEFQDIASPTSGNRDAIIGYLCRLEGGTNDNSLPLVKAARKSLALGVNSAPEFIGLLAESGAREAVFRSFSDAEIERRFDDAKSRWDAESVANIPRDKNGKPIASPATLDTILRDDRRYGPFRFNVASGSVEIVGGTENRVIQNADLTEIRVDVSRRYDLNFQRKDIEDVVIMRARKYHSYDPVEDYFAGLADWDGEPRLIRVSKEILGCTDLLCDIFPYRWMLAATRRSLFPGTPVHTMLVLQSAEQGNHKSRFFQNIAPRPAFYGSSRLDIKNTYQCSKLMQGKVIFTFEELDKIPEKDAPDLKEFITQASDSYVEKYERQALEHPRRAVLGASTNKSEILVDSSGNRRFLVIPTGKIDLDLLDKWHSQLWAEAFYRVFGPNQESHFLTKEEDDARKRVNAAFEHEDPFAEQILNIVIRMEAEPSYAGWVRTRSVLAKYNPNLREGIGGKEPERWMTGKVGDVLRKLGYQRTPHAISMNGQRHRIWIKPDIYVGDK